MVSRERPLRRVDTWWSRLQDTVRRGVPHVISNCLRVKAPENLSPLPAGNNPVLSPRGQPVGECRLEGPDTRRVSRSRRERHIRVRGVIRVQSTSQELGAEEFEMVLDGKDLGFGVKVGDI